MHMRSLAHLQQQQPSPQLCAAWGWAQAEAYWRLWTPLLPPAGQPPAQRALGAGCPVLLPWLARWAGTAGGQWRGARLPTASGSA